MVYFKNGKIISNGLIIPSDFDSYKIQITKEEEEFIKLGYLYIDGKFIIDTGKDKENEILNKDIKKAECKRLILEKYSETDQQNIQTNAIATGDKTELETMRTFITAMITKYRTNGKDADFSDI